VKSFDDPYRGLEASSTLAKETGHPGVDIRPCIACLYETELIKGEPPNRNAAAVVLACEYRRIGLEYDQILKRVEFWNRSNHPPLKLNELTRAVNNGIARDYHYSCEHSILLIFCCGRETCPFTNQVVSKKQRYNDLAFLDYHWQRHLGNRQVLIYAVAMTHLEKTRQVGRGGLVCANHLQIAEACGISREQVGRDLRILRDVGLIEYNVGRPHKWEGIASEIRRIFPIPRPTSKALEFLKKSKTTSRQIEISHNINKVSDAMITEENTANEI
jgi:hypothetical protein